MPLDVNPTLYKVLVTVLSLIALVSVALPLVLALGLVHPCPSKQMRVGLDLQALWSALTLYRVRYGALPSTGEGFQPLVEATILPQHPLDPWGHPYGYELRGDGPRVWSLGADGEAGGEGDDADHFLPEHP